MTIAGKLVFRAHAIQRMFERGITEGDVKDTMINGIIIEEYPDDTPYPSKLMLGWASGRPIHVVCAYDADDDQDIVITVYEPESTRWSADFKRRKG